jgi:hypothetical protein
MYAGRVDDQAEGHLLVKFTKEAGAYFGRLEVRLFTDATSQSTQSKLCELLRATGFDVSDSQIEPPPGNGSNIDPSFFFGDQPEPKYLVAISSSGGDKAIVQQIHEALKREDLKPTWYRDGECRLGTYANAMTYMESLLDPPILLICLSDHYLRYQPNDGWYCSYEFARGIDKYYGKGRQQPGAIVIYIDPVANASPAGTTVSPSQLNPDNMVKMAQSRFEEYASYFHGEFRKQRGEKDKKLQAAFTDSLDAEWDALERDYGSLGQAFKIIPDANQSFDCSQVIGLVREMMEKLNSKP